MINPDAKLVPGLFEGKFEKKPTRDGLGNGTVEAGKADPNVVVLSADLGDSTRASWFQKVFPERFVEVGVAEQNLATVASGMAHAGKIPFIASYAAFSPGRNYEQIRTTIALNDVPVKVCGMHAGIQTGPDGATHQMLEDIALMRSLPNMIVIVPSDAEEGRKAIVAAAKNGKPTYLRFGRANEPVYTTPDTPFEIGKAIKLWESKDPKVAIMGTGSILFQALTAAKALDEKGIGSIVLNVHTVKPLDKEAILEAVKKTGAVVTIEEHQINGGFGSAIAELLGEECPTPIVRLGMNDRFGQSGDPDELVKYYGFDSAGVEKAVELVLKKEIDSPYMGGAKEAVTSLLTSAGITVNGGNPYDVQVHDERLYERVLSGGSLAAGESYMDGWWDAADMPGLFERVIGADLQEKLGKNLETFFLAVSASVFNLQSKSRAHEVAKVHYDAGNDLYRDMLGKRMVYTCGYWSGKPSANTLDEAQDAKLDLVCRKIGLKPGDRVLDVGGGWGSFGKFAAEKYGAKTVAITLSKEQIALGRELVGDLPVEMRLQDYRDVSDGPYDHIVSLGMFEHVGYKNYRVFMEKMRGLLKDDGLFLLHTIGATVSQTRGDAWMNKYIFPNGMLPSVSQLGEAFEGLFIMEDWHNFGFDYSKTTAAWFENFDRAWPNLKEKYGERFYRMWKYYLLSMAGAFRSRKGPQLWQMVFSKNGVPGGYGTVR